MLLEHLEHKLKKTIVGRNFKILEDWFKECTFEEYPTFAPPSSSIKCLIKMFTKLI
jgi:hypothetical protein